MVRYGASASPFGSQMGVALGEWGESWPPRLRNTAEHCTRSDERHNTMYECQCDDGGKFLPEVKT